VTAQEWERVLRMAGLNPQARSFNIYEARSIAQAAWTLSHEAGEQHARKLSKLGIRGAGRTEDD
jgi:hypothetical protein